MFNEAKIKEAFSGLVHFSQPADPSYPPLDNRLVQSTSGRSVNSVHPYLTIENISNVAPQFDNYVYPAWETGTIAHYGKLYTYAGQTYTPISQLTALQNTTAPNASANWTVSNPFSVWLKEVMDQSSVELISQIVQAKSLSGVGKTILESTRLFEGPGLLTEREIARGRFVGYEIIVGRNQHLVINIDKVAVQTDEELAELPIYIFSSSNPDPIATFNISTMGGLGFKWNDTSATAKMFSLNFDPGFDTAGTYYIGYYERDLGSVQAVSKNFDISRPCSSCSRYNFDAYRAWSKRMNITAFSVDVDEADLPVLVDRDSLTFHHDRNFGLNLSVTAKCDISQFVKQQVSVLADAFAKTIALNLMKQIAYTTRINVFPEMARQGAMAELDAKEKSGSLYDETRKSVQAANIEISGFGADCLPCDTRGRINYGAI